MTTPFLRSQELFVRQIGSGGSGESEFNLPTGLTFSPNGLLYVADEDNNRIQIFQPDGAFLRSFGIKGEGYGQLSRPYDLVFGPDGFLYVSERANHRIQVFQSDGIHLRLIGSKGSADGQFNEPLGLQFGPDGLLYVADYANHRIQVFQPDGTFVRCMGRLGTDDGHFHGPFRLAFDNAGLLYVSELSNHRIHVLRTDGTVLRKFGLKGTDNGQLQSPSGIVFGPGQLLYVADYSNNRIQVFQRDGSSLLTFGIKGKGDGEFDRPVGLAFGLNGLLYVTDFANNRIQMFRVDEIHKIQQHQVEMIRRAPFVAIFNQFCLSSQVQERLFEHGLALEELDFIQESHLLIAGVPPIKAGRLLAELKNIRPSSSTQSRLIDHGSTLPDLEIPCEAIQFDLSPSTSSSNMPEGATSFVLFGTLNHCEPVAIKILAKPSVPTDFLFNTFQRELHSWNKLRSSYIVTLYGYSYSATDRFPMIIMERMQFSLRDRLDRSLRHPSEPGYLPSLTDDEVHVFMNHISLGLSAVHARGLIHRDLKADNVLISLDGKSAKLTDFGFTRSMATLQSSTQSLTPIVIGTPGFMAPEMFEMPPRVSNKWDIYAFGMLLYEMIDPSFKGHAAPCYDYDDPLAFVRERHITQWRPPQPANLSPFYSRVYPLVKLTMQESPDERPHVSSILEMLKMITP